MTVSQIMPLPGENLLPAGQVAKLCGAHVNTVRNAMDDGRLGFVLVAGRRLVPEGEAKRFAREWHGRSWAGYREWRTQQRQLVGAA